MRGERGGFEHEGFGTDMDAEVSVEQEEIRQELEDFVDTWDKPEISSLLEKVRAKIATSKDIDNAREQIRRLDTALTDAMGDEDEEREILEAEIRGGKKAVVEDEEDDQEEWEEAA